ncbi:hypothetical protein X798_05759 [Onchocerca flexuosa]|uniref:thioredoxin-dependent peroxiredoxin n=1 Tax=Onchocerca flexuosa TaxID=387005 RepID=A0A238BQI1_9BILA|nr:hypothetical protein X798_05759 [Onchocerca flexuosa]
MTLAGSKAFIGQPAPNFKTTAVVNGDFKEISLCQFKGKYVVCPANWKPGSDTIKPEVKESKEYFGKH